MLQRFLLNCLLRMTILKIVVWIFLWVTIVSSSLYITDISHTNMASSSTSLYTVNAASLIQCSLYCELKPACTRYSYNPRSTSTRCTLYSSNTLIFDQPKTGIQHFEKQFEVDSCKDISGTGYYNITKERITMQVFCHNRNIHIQRRFLPERWDIYFKTDINDYQQGFGDYYKETYWIGNEKLHHLTKDGKFKLHVYFGGQVKSFYATFERFIVGSRKENYRLTIGNSDSRYGELLAFDGMDFYATGFGNPAPANSSFFNGGGWWKPNGSLTTCLNCYKENGEARITYGYLEGTQSIMMLERK